MIESISLTYFRKHEHYHLNLTEGLNVVRGRSEAGKSTLLEAIAYTLFGARALRNSLADVVTWNHKDSELKAEASLRVSGALYTFHRSKAGAEVYVGTDTTPYVTGQNEVSKFASDLLGADINTAHQLMFAVQNGLRGVLEDGPKGTSALIETLANLDLIDELIDQAQARLQLGSTAVLEDRLAQAQANLQNLTVPEEPTKPNLGELENKLAQDRVALTAADKALAEATSKHVAEFQKRDKAQSLHKEEVEATQRDLDAARASLRTAQVAAGVPLPDTAALEAAIAGAKDEAAINAAWLAFNALPDSPSCSREAFIADRNYITNRARDLESFYNDTLRRISALEVHVSASDACPSCGQSTSHLPAWKSKQTRYQEDLAEARHTVHEVSGELVKLKESLGFYAAVTQADQDLDKALAPIARYLSIDTSTIPSTLVWAGGEVSSEAVDIPALQEKLTAARSQVAAINQAQGRVQALEAQIDTLSRRQQEALQALDAMCLVSDDQYHQLALDMVEAQSARDQLAGAIALLEIRIEVAERDYKEAREVWNRIKLQSESLTSTVGTLQKDITSINFNNNLLKKIRAARPVIGNKLWSLVLSTVSTLFSQMRGEQSVVTRTKDGFLVNGKAIESLSGSTLDLLGLATRTALVRTFLPNCGLLITDEPAQGCDEDRTAALLGFIASSGFSQVVLVTHEAASESLATNLIQL